MNKSEGLHLDEGRIWGERPAGPVFFEEHGLRYGADLAGGQKTGFYLDQRENRLAVARYFAGRRVLDACCYSGAFSLVAATRGGAREVIAVDSSAAAIELGRAHAQLNGVSNVHFEAADVFKYLDRAVAARERFDAVILDPPSFARTQGAVAEALRAYHHLNRRAVDLLEPGGVLVTCSCSGQVMREDFLVMLAEVAERSGRDIQPLEIRGAAPDHPIEVTCLESEYLKCVIARVP
jgi:23S rRNA (cytosine1962-C5)-methyltransferase